MTVSGTLASTSFNTNRVIDEAFRECRLVAPQITPEMQQSARNQLFLFLSSLSNKGIPLWCIEKRLLPLYQGNPTVPCDLGTEMPLNVNLRTLQIITGSGVAFASEGDAENAFDQDLATACIQTTPGGNIGYQFEGDVDLSNLGLLPNATGTWDITIQTSDDGIFWTTIYTNALFDAVQGEWQWIDVMETETVGASEALNGFSFIRVVGSGSTTLNLIEFVVANTPNSIPLAKINRDDYFNLPDRSFQGRPTEYWLDRQRDIQYLQLWPAPDLPSTFRQIEMLRQRSIMDVGTLTQTLDIPFRWYDAIVAQLAYRVGKTSKEVQLTLIPQLKADAQEALNDAWTGETDSGPSYLRVNISPYTR